MSIERGTKEIETKETNGKGIPEEIFKAWIDSNLMHPQEAIGIVAYVGEHLFASNIPIDDFSQSQLSDEQVQKARKIMHSAHDTKRITTQMGEDKELIEDGLKRVWHKVKSIVVTIGTKYVMQNDSDSNLEKVLGEKDFEGRDPYTVFLSKACSEGSKSREQLHTFFHHLVKSLQQSEVREIERKRYELLAREGKTEEQRRADESEAANLSNQISGIIFDYLTEHRLEIFQSEDKFDTFIDDFVQMFTVNQ